MKQGAVKKKIFECVILVEKVILSLQTKNQMEKSNDEEKNQLPKCGRKGDAGNLNEKKK